MWGEPGGLSYRNGSLNALARLPSPNVLPGMICSNHSHCLPMKVQTQEALLFGTQCMEVGLLTFSEWGMWVGGCLCREKKKVEVLVTQLCPTLWDPTDCSLPGFSVHGISQVRIVEWVAIPFSRGSSPPRDRTQVSCLAGRFFIISATWEALRWLFSW